VAQQSRQGERLAAVIRAAQAFGKSYPQSRTPHELEERAATAREKALEQGGGMRCPGCGRR
jgi:hypothetical protein